MTWDRWQSSEPFYQHSLLLLEGKTIKKHRIFLSPWNELIDVDFLRWSPLILLICSFDGRCARENENSCLYSLPWNGSPHISPGSYQTGRFSVAAVERKRYLESYLKLTSKNDSGRHISMVDLMLRHSCLGAASHHRAFCWTSGEWGMCHEVWLGCCRREHTWRRPDKTGAVVGG